MSDIPEIPEQSRKPREANRQEWAERLARFDSSGMTVLDFCRAEAIVPQSFYYWKPTPVTPLPQSCRKQVAAEVVDEEVAAARDLEPRLPHRRAELALVEQGFARFPD